MDRYLTSELLSHFRDERQMAFLSVPRQVGKTTIARALCERFGTADSYLNWDNQDHRAVILSGPERIVSRLGLERLRDGPAFGAFDELHKYRRWRDLLKGLFDAYEADLRVLVTGKERREVDFLVARDGEPWFLVEVKTSGRAPLSDALHRFQAQTGAAHAFEVAMDLPFVERDCFERTSPTIVPARTLLAQLV